MARKAAKKASKRSSTRSSDERLLKRLKETAKRVAQTKGALDRAKRAASESRAAWEGAVDQHFKLLESANNPTPIEEHISGKEKKWRPDELIKLKLNTRVARALLNANVVTLGKLHDRVEQGNLSDIKGVTENAAGEIKKKLAAYVRKAEGSA